ncbi:MAG: tRNA lysidine(34) synthetase TilS [Synergistaceae bacterium]|nr:tRNA lysidine(34) synthetase TilS [Synergistaceae bacterium]
MTASRIPYELSGYVLEKYFRETGERQGWLHKPALAVAVSGGGDSVALLWLCRKFYNGRVFAFHVNHGIRGTESDQDEEFVKDFAGSLSVECESSHVNVPNDRAKGESLESAARRLRLERLCGMAKMIGVDTVLTAHNRDDLAETVLFNLLRGTGIRGAVGITEESELGGITFCRPLLGLRREFLREILRTRGLSWREDSTNNDDKYTRNFIRLKLMPMLERHINSEAAEHLAAFGEDMRQVREHEDSLSTQLFTDCAEQQAPLLTMNARKLRRLGDSERALVIREAGRRLGLRTLSRSRCSELSGLIARSGKFTFQWCGGAEVTAKDGKILFSTNGGNYDYTGD